MKDQTIENEIIAKAKQYIKELFAHDSSGHDYYHSIRVWQTAQYICSKEGGNLRIVSLAALLHDVDDHKLFHTEHQANARSFLMINNIDNKDIEMICRIIDDVSFKGIETKMPETLEGKIVQDADRLDAIGAIGIARTFAYGGSHGRELYNPDEQPKLNMNATEYNKRQGTSINHFYEKLFLLKDLMNTRTAKSIAKHRDLFMHQFIAEFIDECDNNDTSSVAH
jgi:uncharacterized protein